MLEERGIASVALGSVRAQMEKTRPPRGLWTSAQLGRPVGEPEDKAFQRRVVLAALRLLERTDGPVILEDFADDPSGLKDTPDWKAPALPRVIVIPATSDTSAASFAAELAMMMPLWRQAQARFGRTTVGLSFQTPEDWPAFASRFLAGELPCVMGHDTPALALRFLCAAPSSLQVDAWFWRQTAAGQLLIALRDVALSSENNALRTVGGRFFVPVPWLP
jgi:hypothetical protein